jgi:endonuclease/exonuclease/phosphatase family metal-dependent hydrolase
VIPPPGVGTLPGSRVNRSDDATSANTRWKSLTAVLATGLFLVLGYVAYTSLDRESPGPATGTVASGTQPTSVRPAVPGRLSVATFNIRRGQGMDGFRDRFRIPRQLSRLPIGTPDLVGLNEVDGTEEGFPHQAAALGMELQRNWIFAPAERRFGVVSMANALLTNLPVAHFERTPLLRTTDKGYRNYLLTALDIDGRRVHVIVTHLDRSSDRDAQVAVVANLFMSLQPPVILMGDLNTERSHPTLRALLATPGVAEPFGALSLPDWPGRIDWIFARGLRPRSAGLEDRGLSDIPP